MLARDVDFLATDTSVQSIKSETLGAVSVSHWNCVHLVGDFPIMSLNSSEYYIRRSGVYRIVVASPAHSGLAESGRATLKK